MLEREKDLKTFKKPPHKEIQPAGVSLVSLIILFPVQDAASLVFFAAVFFFFLLIFLGMT